MEKIKKRKIRKKKGCKLQGVKGVYFKVYLVFNHFFSNLRQEKQGWTSGKCAARNLSGEDERHPFQFNHQQEEEMKQDKKFWKETAMFTRIMWSKSELGFGFYSSLESALYSSPVLPLSSSPADARILYQYLFLLFFLREAHISCEYHLFINLSLSFSLPVSTIILIIIIISCLNEFSFCFFLITSCTWSLTDASSFFPWINGEND